jgi:hypothetical protein
LRVYHNSNDQGLFASNSLPMLFFTNNAERMRIASNGNVGIGTSNPTTALAVVGDISTNGFIRTGAGTVSAPAYSFNGDVSMGLYDPTTNVLGFVTSGVERARIASNGNVGIGTNNPTTLLDISGGQTRLTNSATALALTSTTGSNFLAFQTAAASQRWGIAISNAESSGNAGSDFVLTRSDDLGAQFTVPAVFVRRSNGNVGIGTSAPSYTFDVSGSARVFRNNFRVERDGTSSTLSNADFGSADTLALKSITGYGATTPIASMAFGGGTDYPFARIYGIGVGTTTQGQYRGELAFQTGINATLAERMRINYQGFVGIGTSAPAYTLDVSTTAGNASINMNTWPRMSISNAFIFQGTRDTIGNTLNFSTSNILNTIDSNLMSYTLSNSTTGASFKFLKTGIWAISGTLNINGTSSSFFWMDVCTNDISQGNINNRTGLPVILQTAGSTSGTNCINWTGYLPSNSTYFYKFRFGGSGTPTVTVSNDFYMQFIFLYETASSALPFPY